MSHDANGAERTAPLRAPVIVAARAVIALVSLAVHVPAAAAAPVADAAAPQAALAKADDKHRLRRVIGVAAAIGLYAVSETFAKDALAPDACRWCAPPGFDDRVRDHLVWSDPRTAGSISNLTGYALAPITAAGLLFASSIASADHWQIFGDDMLALTEAAAYTQLAVQALKFSVGRERPYARHASTAYTLNNDSNLSFVSGHSALAFSLATAAGTIAQRHHYQLAPVIWAAGLALAGTTAYLRIAADQHYLTDVLAGGALGAAAGIFVPRLLGSLPDEIVVVPSPTGVAVSGVF